MTKRVVQRFVSCILLLLMLLSLASCSVVQTRTTAPTVSLRSLAQSHGVLIGSAVDAQALQREPLYRDILAREFSILTPENAMKFAALHPSRNGYNFTDADSIVAFAKAHAMEVRGHNLVWFKALPAWLTEGNFSRNELMAILREHIFTVVSHYASQVKIWDVVNEAVDDTGALKSSFWLHGIGPDYLYWAFRWAHEANPHARLFYNDYGGEGLNRKSDAIYFLLKGLLQQGVPITGVGLQMHVSLDAYPKPQDVLANMKRLAALGLEIQITEMDVETQVDPRPMAEKLDAQAQIYGDMLNVCLSAKSCTAFVMWGFTDRHSWIPELTGHPDAPLIFDASYHPKPAYRRLMHVLV